MNKKIIAFLIILGAFYAKAQTPVTTTGNQSISGFKRFNTGLFFGIDSGANLPLGFDKSYTRFGIVYDHSTNPDIPSSFLNAAYGFNDQGIITIIANNNSNGEPRFTLKKQRGTFANPLNTQVGDLLGRIFFTPYYGGAFNSSVSIASTMTSVTNDLYANANLVLNIRKSGNIGGVLDPFIELNPNGNIYLPQALPNMSGTDEVLLRNTQTGAIEKMPIGADPVNSTDWTTKSWVENKLATFSNNESLQSIAARGNTFLNPANPINQFIGVGKAMNDGESSFLGWRYNGGASYGYVETYSSVSPLVLQRGDTGKVYIGNTNDFGSTARFQVNGGTYISGNVLVGVLADNNTDKLQVKGSIKAMAVKVDPNNWPDYVFNEGYKLPSLSKTALFIKENKHLPEVPSAKEVNEKGIELGAMNAILLKKIEELTLHLIDQDQKQTDLLKKVEKLKTELNLIKNK